MAYSTTSPSKSKKSLTRSSSYKSALAGFSTALNDTRKTLLSEQLSYINYQIEFSAASPDEKISLYEQYLSGLTPDTQEYYDTSVKIQQLKDTASTEDLSYAKALYAGNQITADQYYSILKSRAAEQGLSEKEKKQRTLELWDFEQKVTNNATDDQLREAAMQESQGLITAAQRLAMLRAAYDAETDPDRKQSLKYQVINQQDAVYKESLTTRELLVRKGIQEGTATTQDLLPIYAEKIQTAKTPNEALQAEVATQALIKEIQTDIKTSIDATSNDIKKSVNAEIGKIDSKIEIAKRNGDVTGLDLLYNNKASLIQEYMNSEAVTMDDKAKSTTMLNWLSATWGKSLDPESGTVIDVTPTDANNVQVIEDALNNPDSSLLVRKTSVDGTTANYNLVRGEKVSIQNADGTTQSFYDFGKNVAVSRLDSNLSHDVVDPMTGEVLKDAQGNPVRAPSLPSGREVKTLPAGYDTALQSGNLKPLNNKEFKGEYVDLYPNKDGSMVRGYVVYGKKYGDVLGAQPVEGKTDTYLLTTQDNSIPTQKYINENKNAPTGIVGMGIEAAKRVSAFTTTSLSGKLSLLGMTGAADKLNSFEQNINPITQMQGTVNALQQVAQGTFKMPEFKMPDFNSFKSDISSGISKQFLNAMFTPSNPNVILNDIRTGSYASATQGAIKSVVQNLPGLNVLNAGKSLFDLGSKAVSAISGWFNKGGK